MLNMLQPKPTNFTPLFFEKLLDEHKVAKFSPFLRSHVHFVYHACVVYVIAIHAGQRLMRDKERCEMKKFLGSISSSSISCT